MSTKVFLQPHTNAQQGVIWVKITEEKAQICLIPHELFHLVHHKPNTHTPVAQESVQGGKKAAETIAINETIYCQLHFCQTRM